MRSSYLYNDYTVVMFIGGIFFHTRFTESREASIATAFRWDTGMTPLK